MDQPKDLVVDSTYTVLNIEDQHGEDDGMVLVQHATLTAASLPHNMARRSDQEEVHRWSDLCGSLHHLHRRRAPELARNSPGDETGGDILNDNDTAFRNNDYESHLERFHQIVRYSPLQWICRTQCRLSRGDLSHRTRQTET
eukprot:scaffold7586_cov174-Amphora_coffeaeformis.AAC.2